MKSLCDVCKKTECVNRAEPGSYTILCPDFTDVLPVIPGPDVADPNIMELCFRNGERHMKEKICMELTRIAEHMPCITVAQAISMLEGL